MKQGGNIVLRVIYLVAALLCYTAYAHQHAQARCEVAAVVGQGSGALCEMDEADGAKDVPPLHEPATAALGVSLPHHRLVNEAMHHNAYPRPLRLPPVAPSL